MKTPTLAAMATIPGRPLEAALRSIRPQVDVCRVYLNGFTDVPSIVRDLDCEFILDPVNRGAEAKMAWTQNWRGHYFTVDDDFAYPPEYIERMQDEILRWDEQAAIGVLGRRYEGRVTDWRNAPFRAPHPKKREWGAWVNLLGTGTLGFSTKLNVPDRWPRRNCLDPQFAVWGQQTRTPMWSIARPAQWLTVLLRPGPGSVFQGDKDLGFARRNDVLRSWPDWQTYQVR